MFKVNNKNTRTTSTTSFWCVYCYFLTYFTAFSSVSIVDFEQVNVSWDETLFQKMMQDCYLNNLKSSFQSDQTVL